MIEKNVQLLVTLIQLTLSLRSSHMRHDRLSRPPDWVIMPQRVLNIPFASASKKYSTTTFCKWIRRNIFQVLMWEFIQTSMTRISIKISNNYSPFQSSIPILDHFNGQVLRWGAKARWKFTVSDNTRSLWRKVRNFTISLALTWKLVHQPLSKVRIFNWNRL